MHPVVYFSNVSENTRRFVDKLQLTVPAIRIPVLSKETFLLPEEIETYVLITPTYENKGRTNFVPRQVWKFLGKRSNRERMRGVISSGNINFGADYGIAADIISAKCLVPVLYKFELLGTPNDIEEVQRRMEEITHV